MYTLGINAAYHDSAACLVQDGRIIAAAEEERFTRIKHGKRPIPFSAYELPFHAMDYCLKEAGITLADVDHIAYSYDPSLYAGGGATRELDDLFLAYLRSAPKHLAGGVPHYLQKRLRCSREGRMYRWHFVPHHMAHAASAFFVSPFDSAAVMTIDGRGEKATTGYFFGSGGELRSLGEVDMPHSLGLLYEQVTSYLGFLRSSDEYKVMAMASFGKPAYLREFRDIVRLGEKGGYTIEEPLLAERFGPARQRGGVLEARHWDVASSLQRVLEETVVELARWLKNETSADDLCLAGGVALNCVMNARVRDAGLFKRVWVQPAAGDSGTALGAAVLVDMRERGDAAGKHAMEHAYLGPSYGEEEIEALLRNCKLPYRRMADVPAETADLLAAGKIVGWFQGRMEFGPRALGARSILASPQEGNMQAKLNGIKDREDFRPVAPVVLEEDAGAWFSGADASPFMLFIHNVSPDKADLVPAIRHVDGTARIQTIREEQNPRYYRAIKAFKERTGIPILVNTSFNTSGKPIVCTPRDAVECFSASPLDALVMESFLLEKAG